MFRIRFLLAIALIHSATQTNADTFRIREQLGRTWSREFVTFATFHSPAGQWALVDEAGRSLPFQWIKTPRGNRYKIGFQVDVGPYDQQAFRLLKSDRRPQRDTDLRVERRPGELRIVNSKIGIALRTAAANGRGPIAGIKLNSGKWVGDSDLKSDQSIVAWHAQLVAEGPVYVEAVVTIQFADQSAWVSRYRVYAAEPVVLIDEQSTLQREVASWRLHLDRGFAAQSLFYRLGKSTAGGRVGTNVVASIGSGNVFTLEPWLKWWEAERRGLAASVFNQTDPDLLTIAARNAGVWVEPSVAAAERSSPRVELVKDAAGLHADFALARGARSWMIGCHDRDQSLAVMNDPVTKRDSPIPYQYLIKHGHFPLDMLKDYQLQWDSKVARPRMLVDQKELDQFRARVKDTGPYEQQARYFVDHPTTLTVSSLDDAIAAFVVTGDQRLAARLVELCETLVDRWVASLLEQNGMPLGAAPHEKSTIAAAIALADLMYYSEHLTGQRRQHLAAKIALLGYTFARPEYWSVERGYAANPNMTTTVYGYRLAIACFLGDHPMAKGWATDSLTRLRQQLNAWSDAQGGWLEAPHYAVVSYDQILGALVMAHHAGFSDALYTEPKVKLVARWLAMINTPPDSRIGGYRHHPAIGHTYVNEPCGDFGLLAHLFQQRDPAFAAQMQWQFVQNNMYPAPGIGGFYPALAGFRKILTDPDLPAKPPAYSSQLFPQTGVVLRDQYPSARETYLHMILGRHRDHYDDDSGSIVMFGKGRVLIDEFGYRGFAPVSDHSMIECAEVPSEPMEPGLFVTGSGFDYIEAQQRAWQRQIVMVKGTAANDPSYFLINDTVQAKRPLTWRAWMTADEVRIAATTSAEVDGKEDVDMDVLFLSPSQLQLSVEQKTRTASSAMHPDWSWKPMETTQLGLIAKSEPERGVHQIRVLLYPRLKSQVAAKVTALADGKGCKIVHDRGTDYVFLSDQPFTYAAEVSFTGRAGVIQMRGGQPVLKLAGSGRITAGGHQLAQ